MRAKTVIAFAVLASLLAGCGADEKEPTLAEMQSWADALLKRANVTSSSCRSLGGREWKCSVVYEIYINNPQQIMLAGYYENSIEGIWGPKDNQFKILRDYRLIDQRRIR